MSISKESVYAALFAKIQTVAGAVTTSRILRHWNDVGEGEMPAVFQAQRNMHPEQRTGLPAKWMLSADIYIYVQGNAQAGVVPSTTLNNMVDAVEAAIAPTSGLGFQNLGLEGVKHCYIDGVVETDEGTLGNLAMAIIPIQILLAQ